MPLLAGEIEAAKTSLAIRLEKEKEIAAAQRYDAANAKPPARQETNARRGAPAPGL